MAAPVWVLSVDLQTKTATFQSGMADAAKAARGSFNDIKTGSGEMGREVGTNMSEARHGVMLLGEEFGVKLPRALTTFIASLGPIGAAMEAAFPFLAIIVGATLLYEHLKKIKEAGEQLTESQVNFGTTVANVLSGLNDKLLQAGIRADELNGNHLAVLEKQLQLIDHQTMTDLVQEFSKIAKAADEVFKSIDDTSFMAKHFGAGAEGAKHALTQFKTEYDNLLAQGKEQEASGLLSGTLERAKQVLALQEQANKSQHENTSSPATFEAIRKLQKDGIKDTDEAVEAQRQLVDTLQAQVNVQTSLNAIKNLEKGNARQNTQNQVDTDDDKLARARADNFKRETEEQDKLDEQRYQQAVSNIQQAEQEKIAATDKGSAARLAAIDAAIKEENAKGLQETGFYRELLKQRVETAKQMTDEEEKLKADAGKEAAEHTQRMGELAVAAEREKGNTRIAQALMTGQEKIAAEIQLATEEYELQQKSLNDQLAALDQHAQDYANKKKALEDKEEELEKSHQNKLQQIQDQAAQQQYSKLNSSMIRMEAEFAQGFTSVLMRHQSFASMMDSIGGQVVSGMMTTAIKSALAMDFGKEKEAAAAARKFFLAGAHFPFPANIVMAPTLGALAFASMMAFAEGGIVPGVELGDVVPAMLTPGETVIPKKMTEQLSRASDSDASSAKPIQVHVHHNPTIHALDAEGMGRVLQKNADVLTKHVEHTLRKMNR